MRPRFGMHVDHNARMAKGPNFESPTPCPRLQHHESSERGLEALDLAKRWPVTVVTRRPPAQTSGIT